MTHARLLHLILAITVAAMLVAPVASAGAPTLQQRENRYLLDLSHLGGLQNSDGGFGPSVWPEADPNAPDDAAQTAITVHDADAVHETIFTVRTLVAEQSDIYETHRNWEDANVSLAASSVPNTLQWLRAYEADPEHGLTSGDLALLALSYRDLGDGGNAERVLHDVLEAHEEEPGTVADLDAPKILFAAGKLDAEMKHRHNLTLAELEQQFQSAQYTTLVGLSWALLADSDDTERYDALYEAVDASGPHSDADLALAAWALSSGYDAARTEGVLRAVYKLEPTGLARAYYMMGERTAHPFFSPHMVPDLIEGTASDTAGGLGSTGGTGISQAEYDRLLAENDRLRDQLTASDGDEGMTFPLPGWIMATILLGALAVVVVVGLAYGLKREDLDGPRKNIFEYIESNPGEHFSKIRRDLAMAPGTFQHHLSVLESEGWITSHKDARYKRYFVNGNRYQQLIAGLTYKQKFSALANQTTRSLVRFVQANPGVTQKQVAQRLSIHASTVNWHVKRLKQAGLLRDERVGKEVRYTVDSDTVDKMLREAS